MKFFFGERSRLRAFDFLGRRGADGRDMSSGLMGSCSVADGRCGQEKAGGLRR